MFREKVYIVKDISYNSNLILVIKSIDNRLFIYLILCVCRLSVKKKEIIRDYKLNSHTYKDAFIGSCFVEWLVQTERVPQEDAVELGKKLLDFNIIRHG